MSKIEERLISHEEYKSGKYQHVSMRDSQTWARVCLDDNGNINPLSTYTTRYRKEHGLGEFEKKATNEKVKSKPSKASNQKDDDGFCTKLIFTIIPILPIYWILKVPVSLISYPFRKMCSSENGNLWPRYSFKNF